uniref:Uncharacterized protein n=1 Tax=Arundo donax TaxID=35708 RepID=A0A0A9CBS5_ARUDO
METISNFSFFYCQSSTGVSHCSVMLSIVSINLHFGQFIIPFLHNLLFIPSSDFKSELRKEANFTLDSILQCHHFLNPCATAYNLSVEMCERSEVLDAEFQIITMHRLWIMCNDRDPKLFDIWHSSCLEYQPLPAIETRKVELFQTLEPVAVDDEPFFWLCFF